MKRLLFSLILSGCYLVVFAQYNYYSSDGNLFNQSFIETSDGGFLLASYEGCYTPGTTTIEGCVYGIHLVKTDPVGDTLWTNRIDFTTQYTYGFNLFEHDDQTYTIITTSNQTDVCNGTGIGLNGLRQINIITVSETGEMITDVKYPDNCQLTLRDVKRLDENEFLVLSFYDEPGTIGPGEEGRLSIIDNQGNVLNEVGFPGVELGGGRLLLLDNGNILVTYADLSGTLHIMELDETLELVNETTNSEIDYSFLVPSYNSVDVFGVANGYWMVICHEALEDDLNTHFFVFNSLFGLEYEQSHTLEKPTPFLQLSEELFVTASLNSTLDTLTHIQLNFFGGYGESVLTAVHEGDEKVRPFSILEVTTNDNELVVAGSANCCNESIDVGPARAFISKRSPTSQRLLPSVEITRATISPNPASSSIRVAFSSGVSISDHFSFSLYSVTGQLVLEKDIQVRDTQIDLTGILSGIYFYSITSGREVISNGKLIKVEE